MKFATLFTGIVLALPTVLGAVVSTGTTTTGIARRDGEVLPSVQLKARGPADALTDAVNELVSAILEQVNSDNEGRSEFTQKTVAANHDKWPEYNWVICHTEHKQHFDGKQGENWDHFHREYDIQIGGTIGYEIYWFESGKFERIGDGGYLNWAYIGDVASTENGGATVIFN